MQRLVRLHALLHPGQLQSPQIFRLTRTGAIGSMTKKPTPVASAVHPNVTLRCDGADRPLRAVGRIKRMKMTDHS
jgi:hypothetical protein